MYLPNAAQAIGQDTKSENGKALLTDHHKDQFCEGKQCNFDASLGRSLLC